MSKARKRPKSSDEFTDLAYDGDFDGVRAAIGNGANVNQVNQVRVMQSLC